MWGKTTYFLGCAFVAMLAPVAASAATVQYNGTTYYVVDWTSVDSSENIAEGTAGPVQVTFEPYSLQGNDATFSADYSTDPAFDAVGYPSGSVFESLSIQGHGGSGGDNQDDRLTFNQSVGSLIMIIGFPSSTSSPDQYGSSRWDFDDTLGASVIDYETISSTIALQLGAGNVLSNPVYQTQHSSGLLLVVGPFSSLSWTHVGSGTDSMNITFAIAPNTAVPLPASLPLFLTAMGGLGLLGWRRKRSPS